MKQPELGKDGDCNLEFTLSVSGIDDRQTIEVGGELDALTSPQLRNAITAVLDRHPRTVRVVLASVRFLDSSGVAVLAGGYKRARAQDCRFVVCSPSRAVRRVLAVTQLGRFVTIEG